MIKSNLGPLFFLKVTQYFKSSSLPSSSTETSQSSSTVAFFLTLRTSATKSTMLSSSDGIWTIELYSSLLSSKLSFLSLQKLWTAPNKMFGLNVEKNWVMAENSGSYNIIFRSISSSFHSSSSPLSTSLNPCYGHLRVIRFHHPH